MNRGNKALLALLAVSLVCRLVYVGFFMKRGEYVLVDTEMYYRAGEAIASGDCLLLGKEANGGGLKYSGEPLWPLVLSPFAALFPRDYLPVRMFICVLLVASVWFFVRILRHFVGASASIIGGVLYSFYPFYFYFSGTLIQEPLVTALLTVMAWLMLRFASTGDRRFYLIMVVVMALLYYLRVTCIALTPLLLLPLLVGKKRTMGISMLGVFLFVALLLPWGWRNWLATGEFSLLTRTGHVGLPGNAAVGVIEIEKNLLTGMMASISCIPQNAVNYFSPSINNVLTQGLVSPLYKAVSICCVVPLLASALWMLTRIRDRRILLMYGVLALYSAPYLLLFGQTRYRLPIDFVMIVFLVLAGHEVFCWAARRFAARDAGPKGGGVTTTGAWNSR